jgi:predicted O-methyltransferase YrrM
MSLHECFIKYQGKNYDIDGTDKNTTHSYVDLYDKLLSPYKYIYKNIVEIGVFSGGSCAAFAEFFVNGIIYGLDINFDNLKYGKNNDRIKYINADATISNCLNQIPTQFDLVLDDGSHEPYDQIKTARLFVPYISKNGLFICEDINQNYQKIVKDEFQKIANGNNMILEWYDLRNVKNRFDDIVAVIRY